MEGTLRANRSYTAFVFDNFDDVDVLLFDKCGCGCEQYQIFGFDEKGTVRIDLITNDQARHMYE